MKSLRERAEDAINQLRRAEEKGLGVKWMEQFIRNMTMGYQADESSRRATEVIDPCT